MADIYSELPFPRYIQVETIRACNSRCVFCPLGAGQSKDQGVMPDALYDKIEAELAARSEELTRVTLHAQGEPLLDGKIEERVARLKQRGIREVSIATNVSLLNEKRAEALLRAGLDIMRLSISSIIPEHYRQLRVGLDFDAVMKNAHSYFALRDEIRPESRIFVSTEKHDLMTDENLEAWKKHWLSRMRNCDMVKVTDLYDYTAENCPDVRSGCDSPPCHALFQTLLVTFDGKVPLCCNDFTGGVSRHVTGDVNDATLADVWSGAAFRRYRDLHRNNRRNQIDICRGCHIWEDERKENIPGWKGAS